MTGLNPTLEDADDARAECDCRAWAEVAAATIARLTADRDRWRARARDIALIVAEAGDGRPARLDATLDTVRILHSRAHPGTGHETRHMPPGADEPGGRVSTEGDPLNGPQNAYKCEEER